MTQRMTTICIWFVFLFISRATQAVVIVDTGQPPFISSAGGSLYYLGPPILFEGVEYPGQSLAGYFQVSENYVLTDIEGWMFSQPGFLTLSLYVDQGGQLDVSQRLFNQKFFVPQTAVENWHGLNGLNWPVTPGAYWATFESQPGDTYKGAMTGGPGFNAPNPLAKYAYTLDLLSWNELDDAGLGVRIQGNAAVPEPSTIVLFLGGIIGVISCNLWRPLGMLG